MKGKTELTEKIRRQPERTCIGCGEKRTKRELLRIVRTPEGDILPDLTGRMNGRGAYICRNADCIDLAVKKHGFERAFKMPVSADTAARLREEVLRINEAE